MAAASCRSIGDPVTRVVTRGTLLPRPALALLDEVAVCRLPPHAPRLQVSDAFVELVRLSGELQKDPAFIAGHVGPPDVADDLVVLAELVDDGLGHELASEDQLDATSGHRAELNALCIKPGSPRREV